jgi:hypothetical protein
MAWRRHFGSGLQSRPNSKEVITCKSLFNRIFYLTSPNFGTSLEDCSTQVIESFFVFFGSVTTCFRAETVILKSRERLIWQLATYELVFNIAQQPYLLRASGKVGSATDLELVPII